MSTYWLTFRIATETAGGKSYEARWDALYEAVRKLSNSWWVEPTSFVLFESAHGIDTVAAHCQRAVAPAVDLVLVRELDTKSARVIGKVSDQNLFKLMPYLQKV
jgi:hypothetical protein